MLGVYDYTVILTYLSLISASLGIMFSLSGCPYIGVICLLLSGLCDSFDGAVARKKKNRTVMEKNFGIQIDSLSDLVAFGVLPACIGASLINTSTFFGVIDSSGYRVLIKVLLYAILVLYILAALIRLAYFNVTEEERQKEESGKRKVYLGLPVTSASLIFPAILAMQYIFESDVTLVYILGIFITGIAFLLKFKVKKLGLKGILFLVLLGIIECFLLIIFK